MGKKGHLTFEKRALNIRKGVASTPHVSPQECRWIDNHKIGSENSVTLLGIKIDNKLNFEKHVTALCQKPGRQLNGLSRIHKYIGFQEMKMLLHSFIFSYFNYCPVVWNFCSATLSQKIEKIQERAMRLLHNDTYFSYNSK